MIAHRLKSIREFRLVAADVHRLGRFYTAIGFRIVFREAIADSELKLLGLAGGATRTVLRLGKQRIALEQFDRPGAPYPSASSAADLHFQHFAIVTSDAAAAWALARSNGATPITTAGPITLPPSSGGVTAIKFRDPEGHPLEFLQFAPGSQTRWSGNGILGIDHSAVTTSDLTGSRAFYEARGLRVGNSTLNLGPEQAALDGLEAPVVDVFPMHPAKASPHLELLAYRQPGGRKVAHAVNDILATRIVWRSGTDGLIRDPDGHFHQLSR